MNELRLIEIYYGDKCAKRSKVPYINHIYEGIKILKYINASEYAIRAYCLHPVFQMDEDLIANIALIYYQDPAIMTLVMEYRNQANAWLSDKVQGGNLIGQPTSGPLIDVKHMLIADKVQNFKDFELYHKESHLRRRDLWLYFNEWCRNLDIDYSELKKVIS